MGLVIFGGDNKSYYLLKKNDSEKVELLPEVKINQNDSVGSKTPTDKSCQNTEKVHLFKKNSKGVNNSDKSKIKGPTARKVYKSRKNKKLEEQEFLNSLKIVD